MNKRSQQILAFVLIGLGGLYIVANLLDIDASQIFWPIVLILLGVLLIYRPKEIAPENAQIYFAGDKNYSSDWTPRDEDLRMFAGDLFIDLGKADLPAGTTRFTVRCFASDIDVIIPADVGLKISSTGFVVETKIDGDNVSHIMTGYNYKSENYDTAEKKFDLVTTSFAVEINVRMI
jgi:predicted membrane protein